MTKVNEGDIVEVKLKGKVTEIFEKEDYHGLDDETGISVNLKNQGELKLGGIDVFIKEEQLEVLENERNLCFKS